MLLSANKSVLPWVKTLSRATLKLSVNGQWQIFQQVVTYFPSTFSLSSSSIAPLTLKCFTNGTHLSSHPSCEIQLWWENLLYFERQVRREKHRQLFLSSVSIRGEDYCRTLHFRLNYFRTLFLHLTLMPCNHSFPNMVPKSHQFYQLKKKTNPNSYSWQKEQL